MTSTPKSLLVLCCLAVGFLTAASVQAVPTTYQYTGNPFAAAASPYTTSDFVSGMLTLAGPLAPNMPLNVVTPLAFSFSDGVQTLTSNQPLGLYVFEFATGPTGSITEWLVHFYNFNFTGDIATVSMPHNVLDFADSQIG